MFVRLSTYLDVLERAARSEGQAQEMAHEIERLEEALRFERSEVRRLTDMIANLRHEGLVAGPGHGAPEPTWGRYTLDEADAQHIPAEPDVGLTGTDPTSEVDAQAEAEIRQELEEAFGRD